MADQFLSEESAREDSGWSENRAEAALIARIEQEQRSAKFNPHEIHPGAAPYLSNRSAFRAAERKSIWRHVWSQYAAGVLLVTALGITVYRAGRRQCEKEDRKPEATIAALRHQLAQQSEELARLKNADSQLREELRRGADGSQQLAQERINLQRQLDAQLANVTGLQQSLDSLERQSSHASARERDLGGQVAGLTSQIHDRNDTIEQQQELLAHDRDIRELMGARDLYIVEVYDVAGSGTTKKPYGRVFYTKGKSLVFYAYDLDQQNGLKNASTFQAWGRREQDSKHAVNLGVFYEDNAANKRWVLRCDDPKTLAQIDAVFVTVEPDGGSQTPSARKLLFASLKIDPNHP